MQSLIKYVQEKYIPKKEWPDFNSGDTITVYSQIKEGTKTRIQSFKGIVIQRRGKIFTETFTVRKMSRDIGVERVFAINQPNIQNIEINKRGRVRRARIYYFSKLRGKKACIREKRSRSYK